MTIFSRLSYYYANNPDVKPLDHTQKSTLGRKVAKAWYHQGNRNQFTDTIQLVKSIEDTGTYRVLDYPDYFSSNIDKLIGDFYAPTVVPKRKRKPISKPRYSAKPNGNK